MDSTKQEFERRAGICWFKESQWQRLLEIAEDKARLEDTYQQWKQTTEEMIEVFATRGILIEKVPVDVEDLLSWCNEHNKPVNGSSRAEYVTQQMMQERRQARLAAAQSMRLPASAALH
ncbi:hypothetical protein SAMN05421831_101395 [Allopseudospirillum japonicum]|uniref:Uncharacterized protein n=1 Tax=Allopseudospirillum japonicum TaxID=64971 RepID=A0A1H6QMX8_9GAMM|nr:hypothetical protein [Allopseudospirillum japonicum]SEI41537.1 hypothetical protein SAMN05421831_101395 [Allopseudospirillum japonicum]